MASIQWQARPFGFPNWTDITNRIASRGRLIEGRAVESLTGIPEPAPSVLSIELNDVDQYFSTIGRELARPGAQIRLRWGPEADQLSTRFVGNLASRELDNLSGFITTTWAGHLRHIFAGANGSPRLFINKTARQIFTEIATSAGIDSRLIDVDASTDTYSALLSPGKEGLLELEDLTGGFAYDTIDGRVRFELPSTRAAKAISRRYTDEAPIAGETQIARPRIIEDAFRVVNWAQAELRVFAPSSADASETVFDLPNSSFELAAGNPGSVCLTFDTQGLIQDGATAIPSIILSYMDENSPALDADGGTWTTDIGAFHISITLSNITVRQEDTLLSLCFDYEGLIESADGLIADFVDITGTITLRQSKSLDFEERTLPGRPAIDATSQSRHGRHPRERTIKIGVVLTDPLPESYQIPADINRTLQSVAQADIIRYRDPARIPVIEHSIEEHILARRISDREHLRLQDDIDAPHFMEAMETVIPISSPQVLQTAHYAAVDRIPTPRLVPDPPVLGAVPNYTLSAGGSSIRPRWERVIGAAGYKFEWGLAADALVNHVDLGRVLFHTVSNLSPGTRYFGRIRAENSKGPGPWSAILNATPMIGARVPDSDITPTYTASPEPHGIWGDGTNLWLYSFDGFIRVISLVGGLEDVDRRITLPAYDRSLGAFRDLTGDGTYLYLSTNGGHVYVFDLATGTRQNAREFTVPGFSDRNQSSGIAIHGRNFYMMAKGRGQLHTINTANGRILSTVNLTGSLRSIDGIEISDGLTMYGVYERAGSPSGGISAFDIATGANIPANSFTSSDLDGSFGAWIDQNQSLIYISDWDNGKIFAFSI